MPNDNVVEFKPRPKKPVTDVETFNAFFDQHSDFANALLQVVLFNISAAKISTNPSGEEHKAIEFDKYDAFMIREAIMSTLMRLNNIEHPLHEFTEEYIEFFEEDEEAP